MYSKVNSVWTCVHFRHVLPLHRSLLPTVFFIGRVNVNCSYISYNVPSSSSVAPGLATNTGSEGKQSSSSQSLGCFVFMSNLTNWGKRKCGYGLCEYRTSDQLNIQKNVHVQVLVHDRCTCTCRVRARVMPVHVTRLEYSCTNSTNQIAHCEVSKSHSETSYGVSLLSPQGTALVTSYCLLPTWNPWQLTGYCIIYTAALELQAVHISVYTQSLCTFLLEVIVQRLQQTMSGWSLVGWSQVEGRAMWLLDRARKSLERKSLHSSASYVSGLVVLIASLLFQDLRLVGYFVDNWSASTAVADLGGI